MELLFLHTKTCLIVLNDVLKETQKNVLTSSCTASTLGLLPVRRRTEPGPLLAVVASDLDL